MAIVLPGTLCPLCDQPFDREVGYFATSAFLDQPQPLWRYSDAAMHWPCYLEWEHQAEFARLYLAAQQTNAEVNPFWHSVFSSDDVFVTVGEIGQIDILLAKLAFRIRVDRAKWDQWLASPNVQVSVIQPELDRVIPALRLLTAREIESQLEAQSAHIALKKQHAEENGFEINKGAKR